MKISRNERIKLELQMLTGVLTDDVSYLCYLLLKEGSHFEEERSRDSKLTDENMQKIEKLHCESFEDFFGKL